jgi:plasmid stability protein
VATLYVRNVPEDLYARLREQAEAHGRPIGGEALQLLAEQLPAGARRGRRFKRPAAAFERFEVAARAVITHAKLQAAAASHGYIGTEHLLLGVLAELPIPGLELDAARKQIEQLVPPGDAPETANLPYTARSKHSLELAIKAAGAGMVGPVHIALGLLEEGEGIAAQVLTGAGIDGAALRAAAELQPEPPAFRVVELSGDAERWTEMLNAAVAEDEYELVSIVDGRAVLRRV